MKKLFAIIIISAIILTGCSNNRASVIEIDSIDGTTADNTGVGNITQSESIMITQGEIPIAVPTQGNSLKIPEKWVTEHGAYYTSVTGKTISEEHTEAMSKSDGSDFISFVNNENSDTTVRVYITDSSTSRNIVLCNKPNCRHDTADCGAVLPAEVDVDERLVKVGHFLFIDGDYIYAFNGMRTIYKISLDGSSRTEYMKIPDKYQSGIRDWLMNGKLYMSVSVQVKVTDEKSSSVAAVIEVDYINKTTREIWVEEYIHENGRENSEIHTIGIVGVWEGKVYIQETFNPPVVRTPAGLEAYYKNQNMTIFAVSVTTGEREKIYDDTGEGGLAIFGYFGFDDNAESILHSNRDETLFRYNLLTGKRTVLVENLPGIINILDTEGDFLKLERNNDPFTMTNPYSDLEYLYYNLVTGELS
jgi:hypothetical protein